MPNINDLTINSPMSMTVVDPLGGLPAEIQWPSDDRLLSPCPAELGIDLLKGLSPAVVADIQADASSECGAATVASLMQSLYRS